MKKILILFALTILMAVNFTSIPSFASKIEKINLNIKEHEMSVTFISLSEGEAILIQGPNSKNILVNTGGKDTEQELEDWLSLYRVKEIDLLILTQNKSLYSLHQLSRLIDRYQIKKIAATPILAEKGIPAPDEERPISITAWTEGTKIEILPELMLTVLYAGKDQNEGLDFALDFSKHRIFLLTSLSPMAQETLLRKSLESVNIFKIPNVGKDDFISEKLIDSLNPEISILIASGKQDPNSKVLTNLQSIWSEAYSTKKHGTITIKFTDSKYELFTFPANQ